MQLLDAVLAISLAALLTRAFPTSDELLKDKQALNYYSTVVNCSLGHNITVDTYLFAFEKNSTNDTQDDTLSVYEKAKCVSACILKTYEILKPDGSIDMSKAMEHLLPSEPGAHHEAVLKNIKACDYKGPDECSIASNFMACALSVDVPS